jgi:DNA-binding response OmpR family regulator
MSTLTVYIRWLREKLEDDPKNPEYIHTVWRVGYKFGGESSK